MEDLGNNRHSSTLHVKVDLVGPGWWSVVNDPQTNRDSLDCGLHTTNNLVVGGEPDYGFHPPGSDDPACFRVCSS